MVFAPRPHRDREPAVPMKPLVDPAGWTAEELAASDDWIYELSEAERTEISAAVAAIEKQGLDIKDVQRNDFVVNKVPDRDGARCAFRAFSAENQAVAGSWKSHARDATFDLAGRVGKVPLNLVALRFAQEIFEFPSS